MMYNKIIPKSFDIKNIPSRSQISQRGIKFDVDIDLGDLIIIKQDALIFAYKNVVQKYYKQIEYPTIIIQFDKEYLLDVSNIIGIIKATDTTLQNHTKWYKLAYNVLELSGATMVKFIDPNARLTQTFATVAKSNFPAAASNTPANILYRTNNKIQKSLSTSAYNKHKSNLQYLSIENCKQIISELQQIDDLSQDSKQQIINPKSLVDIKNTRTKINFDSDIILTALSQCYYDPRLNVKDVLNVIDEDKLCSKYKASTTPKTSGVAKISAEANIVEAELIQQYRDSCEKLRSKNVIEFTEYLSHMQILIAILQSIYEYFKNNDQSIAFNLFDRKTLDNVIAHIQPGFNIHKINNINRGEIFDDRKAVKTIDNVLKNTFLDRAINLKFYNDIIPKIMFNHRHTHNILDDIYEYHKYISILPKFHCIDSTALDKTNKETILKILSQLNEITRDIPDTYTIKGINKDIYIKLFQDILSSSYTNAHDINKLLCVIINNNCNEKKGIQDYYYYFDYDGPAPATSVLNAVLYVKYLHLYQPLHITSTVLSSINDNYKGYAPLFSKIVNEGLQNHILNGVKLSENTIKKIIQYKAIQANLLLCI